MNKLKILTLALSLMLTGITNASTTIIYFGNLEVKNGALKSASGVLPAAGETVLLRIFSEELSAWVLEQPLSYQGIFGLYGVQPHLFVRFNAGSEFTEYPLNGAQMINRGPYFLWELSAEDVELKIPAYAENIEAFLSWDRVRPTDCYLAYDMTECSSFEPSLEPAYISNYARNFKIQVR